MVDIVTRELGGAPKGSPLSNAEIDQNFLNVKAALEAGGGGGGGGISGPVSSTDGDLAVFSGTDGDVLAAGIARVQSPVPDRKGLYVANVPGLRKPQPPVDDFPTAVPNASEVVVMSGSKNNATRNLLGIVETKTESSDWFENTNGASSGAVIVRATGANIQAFEDGYASGEIAMTAGNNHALDATEHKEAYSQLSSQSTVETASDSGDCRITLSSYTNHFEGAYETTVGLDGFSGGEPLFRLYGTSRATGQEAFLELAPSITPGVPDNGLKLYVRNIAGRQLLTQVGPSGLDTHLQPALFRNSVYMWLPGAGTTLSIAWGSSWTARNSGTGAVQAHPTKASTNALTSMSRATFGTGTTSTGASGVQSTASVCWRGNAAGLGGFFFFSRFAVETYRADVRIFVGLSALSGALNAQPSTINNSIGICKDSGDTNWFIMTRSGTAVTKTDTGLAIAAGTILELLMFAPPNSSDVSVCLVNAMTGEVIVDNLEITANLPVATTFMAAHAHIQSTTGTTAALLALNRIYVETDL